MKSNLLLLLVVLVALSIPMSCKDIDPESTIQKNESLTIKSARKWFDETFPTANLRIAQDDNSKTLLWNNAFYHKFPFGKAVIVPIHYKNPLIPQYSLDKNKQNNRAEGPKSQITNNVLDFLVIRQNNEGKYVERILKIVPDEDYLIKSNNRKKQVKFDGLVLFTDWKDNIVDGYKYKNGKRVSLMKNSRSMRLASEASFECESTDWYSCVSGDHGATWYCRYTHTNSSCWWVSDGSTGYTPPPNEDYDCPEFATGGGDINYAANEYFLQNYVVKGPLHPINIVQKLNCFGNIPDDPKYKYKITLYLDEPVYSKRDLVDFSLPQRKAGHTYIGFERFNSQTNETVRLVAGFYTQSEVSAASTMDCASVWGDDGGTSYDAALSLTVTAAKFKDITDAIKGDPLPDYNLVYKNCTTYAAELIRTFYPTLPYGQSMIGPMGPGYNPPSLVEDLRSQATIHGDKLILGNNLISPSSNCSN